MAGHLIVERKIFREHKNAVVLEIQDGRRIVVTVLPREGRCASVGLRVDADPGVTILRGELWVKANPDEKMVALAPNRSEVA